MPNCEPGPADSVTGPARPAEVAPERFTGWIRGFRERHGDLLAEPSPDTVTFRAADGSAARCEIPFPPLAAAPEVDPGQSADLAAGLIARHIARHALAEREVGVVLVRLGGYAVGVFSGAAPELAASKVGTRLVHGRSAAGGTSQRRFARRRENQAAQALAAAADTAAAVLGPYAGRLDAVVVGGDRRAIAGLKSDARLAPFFELATSRFLTVPNPRLSVLRETPRLFRAIRISVTGPRRLS